MDSINRDFTSGDIKFVNNVQDTIDLELQQAVIITRGFITSTDTYIFRGYISGIEKDNGTITVSIMDKVWLLQRKLVNTSYDKNIDAQAGVGSAIAEDLIETYGGMTASVESTGTAITLNKFICKNDVIYERLKKLAQIYDYNLYYDPETDTVNFESKGYKTFAIPLVVGTHIFNTPSWNYDYSEMANLVRVVGGTQEVETTEFFSGDGNETEFSLDFLPKSVKVYISNVLKTGGIVGSTASYDYSVDADRGVVIFVAAPAIGANNVEVRYSYEVPRTVITSDDDSISKYGVYEAVLTYNDIEDVDDAIERARKVLDRRSTPTISSKLEVAGVTGLSAGYKITVQDEPNGEERETLIETIKYQFPKCVDTYEVGDGVLKGKDIVFNINERLRRIERELSRDADIIVQLLQVFRFFKPHRRYCKLIKDSVVDTDVMIWNHPTQGIWNAKNWGSGAIGSQNTLLSLVQGQNTYAEYLYDNDFNDTGSTTATVNTTTHTVTF